MDKQAIRKRILEIMDGRISTNQLTAIIELLELEQNARIAALEAALHQAQSLLRSTQANWNEQAYFDADNVITNALEGK